MRDDAGAGAVSIVSAGYAKLRTQFDKGASNRHAPFLEPSMRLAAERGIDGRAARWTFGQGIAERAFD
jgi:hypothetical protein